MKCQTIQFKKSFLKFLHQFKRQRERKEDKQVLLMDEEVQLVYIAHHRNQF